MSYRILVGVYDHKLGPICAGPKVVCEWLKSSFENNMGLIQDGLNTKSNFFTIKNSNYRIQTFKFFFEDESLRGGKLRCCLFCMVPPEKSLLPEPLMIDIFENYKLIVQNHHLDFSNPECDKYLVEKELWLNRQLNGTIGIGKTIHKRRDLLTSIIGFSELLLDDAFGSINQNQKDVITNILTYAKDLLNVIDDEKSNNI